MGIYSCMIGFSINTGIYRDIGSEICTIPLYISIPQEIVSTMNKIDTYENRWMIRSRYTDDIYRMPDDMIDVLDEIGKEVLTTMNEKIPDFFQISGLLATSLHLPDTKEYPDKVPRYTWVYHRYIDDTTDNGSHFFRFYEGSFMEPRSSMMGIRSYSFPGISSRIHGSSITSDINDEISLD